MPLEDRIRARGSGLGRWPDVLRGRRRWNFGASALLAAGDRHSGRRSVTLPGWRVIRWPHMLAGLVEILVALTTRARPYGAAA